MPETLRVHRPEEQPLTEEFLRHALRSDYKGVAGALELFRRQTHAETVSQLVTNMRASFNSVGNLQFASHRADADHLLHIQSTMPGPLNVVVVGSLVEEAINRLRTAEAETRSAVSETLGSDEEDESDGEEPAESQRLAA